MSTAAALAQKTCPRCGSAYSGDAAFCAKDGSKLDDDTDLGPDSDEYIGTIVSGDIELRSVAGVGAMGRVYRAHQRGIDRDVAVKILHREMSGNAQLVQRFHREAKIASKLQHPHVVEVYLAGQLPDKALYIVMEYLDGMSLAAALSSAGGVFPAARALSIALQICDAVGEGHARGIVHRDLKPENVMLVRRAEMGDWVKVLDFGIAKVQLGEQSMQTAAGLVFGTARYISPEGAQGANVGPPGDVYSLATMVYQMLAGRTPFDAEPVGLLIKHIHEPPPLLTTWPRAADTHPALVKVVMDNLAKDPTRRAAGARVFASQLANAAREANISISEVGVVARLSNVDFGRASLSPALDPTLDDAAAQLLLHVPRRAPALEGASLAPSEPPVAAGATVSAPPLAPARTEAETRPSGEARPRQPLLIILVAFVLGAMLALLITQQLGKRVDHAHHDHVLRARRALAETKYVSPPGDNVRELLGSGFAKWPDDPELTQVRSEASHEMVTRSLVARAGGDVGGARDLARDASQLDPSDHAARILLGQYQEETEALTSPGGMFAGPPKVMFESPPVVKPAQRMDLVAHIAPGSAGGKAKIAGTKITVFENGKTTGGVTVPFSSSDVHTLHATMSAPRIGSYDIIFEANVDGTLVRAQRDLDVLP